MKRIMVVLGLGFLFVAPTSESGARAEMPVYISASGIPAASSISTNGMSTSGMSTSGQVVWHKTLQAGWAEARRRDVPMVIYITTENCQYCEAMKRDTWCDQTIGQRLQDFVAIRLTPKENRATVDRIKLKMFPATLIGLPQGKIIDHRYGYQPKGEIHQVLSNAKARRVARR